MTAPFASMRTVALLAALLGCLACLGAAAGESKDPEQYRLQAGDEIAVGVVPQKGWDCKGVILPDGVLRLPRIGKVIAAGLTLDELEQHVKKLLDSELIDPEVTVTLEKMAPPKPKDKPEPVKLGKITIVGAVGRTGPLDLEEGLRLRKALDYAGGTSPEADLANIVIYHKNMTRTIVDLSKEAHVLDPGHNTLLQDGDSVEIRALPKKADLPPARIGGQVVNPGQHQVKEGMTLEDLIVQAGKLTPLADVENVQLQRRGKPVETINLVEGLRLGLKGKVLLEPGDEVFVPEQTDTITIIGAVGRGGPRALKPGQTVRDLFLHGGDDLTAATNPAAVDQNGIELIRHPENKPRKLPLKEIIRREDHPANIELKPGDILYIPPKKAPKRGILDFAQQLGPLSFLFAAF